MNPYDLAALITTAAIVVSKNTPDDDELSLLALAFTQLGDTLATIAEQRTLLAAKEEKKKNCLHPSSNAIPRVLLPGGLLD